MLDAYKLANFKRGIAKKKGATMLSITVELEMPAWGSSNRLFDGLMAGLHTSHAFVYEKLGKLRKIRVQLATRPR